MTNQKKQDKGRTGVNPIAAAVAGAVVGAGIAVAGVTLTNEKNREKVKKAATNVKDQTMKYVEGKKSEGKEEMKKVINSAKDSLHKASKDVNKAVQSI